MSILNAIKQQGSSIDDLAKLPQAMIMQMVQKKQINETMLAPILARKAELTDAIARTKAMQAGGQQPTVMEQLMQRNAEAEQPEPDAREMGIAANPIPKRDYAGGGIVAFQAGGSTNDVPPREPGESENDYMKRVQMMSELGGQFFTPRNYNPIAKLQDIYGAYQENIGQPFAEGVKRFTSSDGTASFNKASDARKAIGTPSATALPPMPTNVKADPLGRTDAAKQGDKAPAKPASKTETKPAGLKSLKPTPNVEQAGPQQPSELQELLAQARSEIESSKSATEKARQEAKWSRLLEAGLGIMGGESTNFAQNIGRGATQAARGYAEDVKGLRAEDIDRQKQLAGLRLKGYELGQGAKKLAAEEQYMKQHGKYFEQIGAAALQRGATNLAGVDKVDIAALKVGLDNAQKALLTAKKADRPVIQKQIDAYINRINSLAGISQPTIAGGGTTFNYVPGKGLVPVQ